MPKLDPTIESLLADAHPVRPAPRPAASFFLWGGVTLVATLILMGFSSLRPDLGAQLHSPLFVTEAAALAFLIAALAFDAVWLCFPDLRQKAWVLWLPLAPLAVYLGCTLYRAVAVTAASPPEPAHGMACILCITLYSLVPGFWMFRTLRRHATTHPLWAGAVSLLAAASIGLLVLKLVEPNDSVLHLLKWHLIPVALFGVIGALIGRKFLRW